MGTVAEPPCEWPTCGCDPSDQCSQMKVRATTPRQRFWRGHRVKIADVLPAGMSNFRAGVEAIVIGSYSDLCSHWGGGENESYTLHVLDKWPGSSAWYPEAVLTLTNADRDAGERILQQHKLDKWLEYLADSESRSG